MCLMLFAIWHEQADAAERLPPWQTVYWWFRRFMRRLLFRTIHDVALMLDREREGREQNPTATVVDSQSTKAPAAEKRGFGLVTVLCRSGSTYATLASKASGLIPPRYEWRRRGL